MTRPLISAIVPVFNGERHLREALESIAAQEYEPLEIVVVDDGSTDGSRAIAEGFPGVRYAHQPNAGVAAARNRALALARGEFVAFLDQDDRWTPDKLAVQLPLLLDDPGAGLAVAKERIVLDDGVTELPRWVRPGSLEEDYVVHLPGVVLARRALFDTVGLFDPAFENGSDSDWIIRCRQHGVVFAVADRALLLRRIHRHNASHRESVSRSDIFRALHGAVRRNREQRRP